MDEMRIKTPLLKGIICKILEKQIKKKFGYDIFLDLKECEVKVIDGEAHISLAANAKIPKECISQISQLL